MWTLVLEVECARGQAGVDGDDGAAVVAAAVRGEKGDHRADFLRRAAAREWKRLEQLAPVLGASGAICRLLLHQTNQPVGFYRPGVDRDDPDAVLRADAAERLAQGRQRRIA